MEAARSRHANAISALELFLTEMGSTPCPLSLSFPTFFFPSSVGEPFIFCSLWGERNLLAMQGRSLSEKPFSLPGYPFRWDVFF